MNKFIKILPLVLILVGCSQRQSQINVKAAYPNAEIVAAFGESYTWYVKTETNIMKVYNSGDGEVGRTVVTEIFKLTSPESTHF